MAVKKLAMVVDASRCMDCKGCMAACKEANDVPTGYWRNWIKPQDMEKAAEEGLGKMVFQPGNCMHCDQATCVTACPTGATYKNAADGTVQVDRGLCIGCGQCIAACPYGARYRHPQLRVVDKCDFCAGRRAQGLEPACVSTCPTKARVFGDLNDPDSDAAILYAKQQKELTRVINPQSDTKPNIYYVGNPGDKDWPVEARMPGAWQFWRNLADPLVKISVGVTGLGVLAMLGKQLLMKDDAPEGGDHE